MIAHLTTPAMGLIVLRVDETIEHEFRRMVPADQARLHITRVRSGDDLTVDSISAMEAELTGAASLLPPAAGFDVIGYACTSGAAILGAKAVADRVLAGVATRAVTDPLTAAVAQMEALQMRRIGIVSPYVADVSEGLVNAFERRGISVLRTSSFDLSDEAKVARIDPDVTAEAARQLAAGNELDGIFLSCTNLNTTTVLEPLSSELGIPVLSSNQVLAAHMRALCGLA